MDIKDIQKLVQTLNWDDMEAITEEYHLHRKRLARNRAQPLTDDEQGLVIGGEYIKAVKAYRTRFNCDLLEAKVAVDIYRDGMNRE